MIRRTDGPDGPFIGRLAVGTIAWAGWLGLFFLLALFVAGAVLSLVDPYSEESLVGIVSGPLVYLLVGMAMGSGGAAIADRLRLTEPTRWAPSFLATFFMLVGVAGNGDLTDMLRGLVAFLPVFIGQAAFVRWSRNRSLHAGHTAIRFDDV